MDDPIRAMAFQWLGEQVEVHGDVLPWSLLQQGFSFQGERVILIGQQGIWKPKALQLPLSITTSWKSPYDDAFEGENLLLYRYRRGGAFHRENVGLRTAYQQQVPLVYFHGILQGWYLAVWPVFVVADDPPSQTFTIAADDVRMIGNPPLDAWAEETTYRRRYVTAAVKVRLHQRSFRARVLSAYQEQCAFCRLQHPELLDAAHIIPDRETTGEPMVTNGISLCKIHHAVFDRNLVGVSPDYQLVVREAILSETDGPMLQHGIQQLHEQKLILPAKRKLWPDRERLSQRFERFQRAM